MAEINPYAPPVAQVEDPFPVRQKATRRRRLAGAIVDGLARACVSAVVVLVAIFGFRAPVTWDDEDPVVAASIVIGLAAIAPVQILLLVRHGQSIGKRLLGMRVVRPDGGRPGPWRLVLVRLMLPELLAYVPLVGTIFSLADALFIFREDRRCLHDHMAGTIVVNTHSALEDNLRLRLS